jgi:hypothetical protein
MRCLCVQPLARNHSVATAVTRRQNLATKPYADQRKRKSKRVNAILRRPTTQLLEKQGFVAKNAYCDITPAAGFDVAGSAAAVRLPRRIIGDVPMAIYAKNPRKMPRGCHSPDGHLWRDGHLWAANLGSAGSEVGHAIIQSLPAPLPLPISLVLFSRPA